MSQRTEFSSATGEQHNKNGAVIAPSSKMQFDEHLTLMQGILNGTVAFLLPGTPSLHPLPMPMPSPSPQQGVSLQRNPLTTHKDLEQFCEQEGKKIDLWEAEVGSRADAILREYADVVSGAMFTINHLRNAAKEQLAAIITFRVALDGEKEQNDRREEAIDKMTSIDINLVEMGWESIDILHAPVNDLADFSDYAEAEMRS